MQFHILNGDSLLMQLPDDLWGETIVARECLVDGDVTGESLEELFETRSAYFQTVYTAEEIEYKEKTVAEFERMLQIPKDASVSLWFEEDLFCQVNLWFVAHLLVWHNKINTVTLVLPNRQNRYGFGGMDEVELENAFKHRQVLQTRQLFDLAQLWKFYQANDIKEMERIAALHKRDLPFLEAAVAAHAARYPVDGSEGRPKASLRALISKYGSEEFGPVFRAFCQTEAIYGFGDMQVKRLFDEIVAEG